MWHLQWKLLVYLNQQIVLRVFVSLPSTKNILKKTDLRQGDSWKLMSSRAMSERKFDPRTASNTNCREQSELKVYWHQKRNLRLSHVWELLTKGITRSLDAVDCSQSRSFNTRERKAMKRGGERVGAGRRAQRAKRKALFSIFFGPHPLPLSSFPFCIGVQVSLVQWSNKNPRI